MRRSRRLKRVLLALFALATSSFAFAQDTNDDMYRTDSPKTLGGDEAPPAAPATENWEFPARQREAIKKGLTILAHKQMSSGFWVAENGRYNMAVTALCGLAFLANGEQPGRSARVECTLHPGENEPSYGERIERAIRWVLANQKPENEQHGAGGLFYDHIDFANEREDRPMHGHGYAMLFLAEAYGQTRSPDLQEKIKKALVRAVALTERTQSREGGWFYRPGDNKDEGSVTITQIQGLRSAYNAGIPVSKSTIDRAVDYIRRSQLKSGDRAGGVRYTIHWGDPSPALTAAGIAVYYGAGEYGSPGIEKGFEYLSRNMRLNDKHHFWYYTHFYAVQAMYQRGNPEWKDYYRKLQHQLLGPGGVRPDGSWRDETVGTCFGTAVALLCLEIPLGYLPIFQR